MATYREIQYYIEKTYGFVPHPCWIAEVKELHHIPLVSARLWLNQNFREGFDKDLKDIEKEYQKWKVQKCPEEQISPEEWIPCYS